MIESRIFMLRRVARRQLQWRWRRGRPVKVSADKSTEVRAHRVRTHLRHAACLRATSQLRAHCPLLWPQIADKRFSRLDGRLGQLLQVQFDAVCAAAALHAIRIMLEDRALPSAASERVF